MNPPRYVWRAVWRPLAQACAGVWLLLKPLPALAWGFIAALLPALLKSVTAVAALLEAPLLAGAATVVGIVAVTAATLALLSAGADPTHPLAPTEHGDAARTPRPAPPPRPDDGSRSCRDTPPPLIDDWIDPQHPVDSLIITEVGSSDRVARVANPDKWNLDAGADATRTVLELAADDPVAGSWLMRLPQPLNALQARGLVQRMVEADRAGAHGPGCQYAAIEVNSTLRTAGLSGPDELDYDEQSHLRAAQGADFVGAWQLLQQRLLRRGWTLKPVTVAVIDLFLDPHGAIAQHMPVDVEPPHSPRIAASSPKLRFDDYEDHGDMVASLMFWPNRPELHGAGALRLLPAAQAVFRYMPVPLRDAKLYSIGGALQAVSGVELSKIPIGDARVSGPPLAQVVAMALSVDVPITEPRLRPGAFWTRVVQGVRRRPQAPVLVTAGGNDADMRNSLADPLGVSALGARWYPGELAPTLFLSYDDGLVGQPQAVQIAAPAYKLQVSSMTRDGEPRVGWAASGASIAVAQVAAASAMLLAMNPKLGERGVIRALSESSNRRAYDLTQDFSVPLLDARAAVRQTLPWYCAIC